MKEVTSIFELIKDPTLVFILAVLGLLGWIIISLLKTIKDQVNYERELMSELNSNSTTLARLTALIETLVHGRGGGK